MNGDKTKNGLASTLLEMAGQKNVITVHRAFVNFTGSLEAGMLFSQLLYWTPRSKDGWIAKSDAEFIDELCLTRYAIREARRVLEKMCILETKLKKFKGAPTVHYRLLMESVNEKWIVWIQNSDYAKSHNEKSETEQSLTEITPEITQRINGASAPAPSKPKPEKVPAEILTPMVDVLSTATGQDKTLNYPRLAKEAKALLTVGYLPEQIKTVYVDRRGRWFTEDWRGKKGQKPSIGQIKETIGNLSRPVGENAQHFAESW